MYKQNEPAFYRMKDRRLSNLSNEELQALFEIRAAKIKLDPKGLWDDNKMVSCWGLPAALMDLYEIMLEMQARYPKEEICKYADIKDGRVRASKDLLPVPEKWANKNALKELPIV